MLYLILMIFFLSGSSASQNVQVTMENIIESLLSTYNVKIRPHGSSGIPVTVNISIYVNTLGSVREVDMEYKMDIYLRQYWNDPRLSYNETTNDIVLSYRDFDRIWVPDIFFRTEKKASSHIITVPNRLLRITPIGNVLYSQRLTLTNDCAMNFKNFPLDSQKCSFTMASYSFTTEDIKLEWALENPIIFAKNITMPEFTLDRSSILKGSCSDTYITGVFDCLFCEFVIRRELGYYMIQTYVPSLLIVVLSWVSFWIDHNSVPARISLGLLTVLTITTQTSGIRSQLPKVSYIKGIDVWMSTCTTFVFASLLEYSIVNVLARKDKKYKNIYKINENGGENDQTSNNDNDEDMDKCIHFYNPAKRALSTDRISRIIFPGTFLLFNIFYWTYYVLHSKTL